MNPISLLIFDLDGTLVNTLGDITDSVNYALARLGREKLPEEAVRRFVGDGTRMLLTRSLGGSTDHVDEGVRLYKEYQHRNLVVHSRLYPGVQDTLQHFRSIPLAVISNKATEFVDPLLARLGIASYFKKTIGADSGLPLKPAPDGLFRMMDEFQASRERTLIVGDGTADMKAGKAAGVITCGAVYGFRSEEELRAAGADYLVRTMGELKSLFQPVGRGTG